MTGGPGYARMLEPVTRIAGVRGAMIVSGDDGLMVEEQLLEGVPSAAVAALAASLARRLARVLAAAAAGAPTFWHLQGDDGALLAVPAPGHLLVVAIAAPDVNIGLVRLELLRAAGGGG